MEVFQREQERIGAERRSLESRLSPDVRPEDSPARVKRAMELLGDFKSGYLRANPSERRGWNRALFQGFWVGGQEIRRVAYNEPYQSILVGSCSTWRGLVAQSARYSNLLDDVERLLKAQK